MRKPRFEVMVGDCRDVLAELTERQFHCCVTSPPYWGLRDYGVDGQIGLEDDPDHFIDHLLGVFGGEDDNQGVWRVLRDDGVLWVNLGDKYAGSGCGGWPALESKNWKPKYGKRKSTRLKPKQLMLLPQWFAICMQAVGWLVRDIVIWHKPTAMPGSQRDRCTSAYEYVFQFTKKPNYYWDMEAVREPCADASIARLSQDIENQAGSTRAHAGGKLNGPMKACGGMTRVPRNVWKIRAASYADGHFATYPVDLPLRCIKATTSEKGCCLKCGASWIRQVDRVVRKTRPGEKSKIHGVNSRAEVDRRPGRVDKRDWDHHIVGNRDPYRKVTETRTVGWAPGCDCDAGVAPCRVLDPFSGAGTTGIAANQLWRDYVGIELNAEYAAMSRRRAAKALRPQTYRDMNQAVEAPLFEDIK